MKKNSYATLQKNMRAITSGEMMIKILK